MELKLKKDGESLSPEKIRSSLNSMNFAKVSLGDKNYLIKTNQEAEGSNILRALKDKTPHRNPRKHQILI